LVADELIGHVTRVSADDRHNSCDLHSRVPVAAGWCLVLHITQRQDVVVCGLLVWIWWLIVTYRRVQLSVK